MIPQLRQCEISPDSILALSPGLETPPCGSKRYRWRLHIPLPFVLPLAKPLIRDHGFNSFNFCTTLTNSLDRFSKLPPNGMPQNFLVPKKLPNQPEMKVPEGWRFKREVLPAVADIVEITEQTLAEKAFDDVQNKIEHCFSHLASLLGEIQRSLPFNKSWNVYPVTFIDTGTVHHSVEHFCTSNTWQLIRCGIAFSPARQLSAPTFIIDEKLLNDYPQELRLIYELLAEAQTAIFRRINRLAVINAVSAVELLAQNVFIKLRTEQLLSWGVPIDQAGPIVEEARKQHRTDEKFLLNFGIKAAFGKSLQEDAKELYDAYIKYKVELRHRAAHAGYEPSVQEARRCYTDCCKIVQWLSNFAGYPVKPLEPSPDSLTGLAQYSAPGW